MPRTSRLRAPNHIHHIMCKSISEINLFRCDEDKLRYLLYLKKYVDQFYCSVLGYCLMSNHVHIQFDPQGADISKVMHCLHVSYAMYYNGKYHRRGPLFQERFVNKVVTSDRYNLVLSAYIHNNPKDLSSFSDCVHEYSFSSFGIYLGINPNHFDLVNTDFILSYFGNPKNTLSTRKLYYKFVLSMRQEGATPPSFEEIYTTLVTKSYHSTRILYTRYLTPNRILEVLQQYADANLKTTINVAAVCIDRGTHKEIRAIAATLMRSLCNYTYKQLADKLGDISPLEAAKLHRKGCHLLTRKSCYKCILEYFSRPHPSSLDLTINAL